MDLSQVFGVAGSILVAVIVVPQAVRVHRHGVSGISPSTYQLMLAVNLMWLSYFIAKHHYAGVPGLTIASFVTTYVLFISSKSIGALRSSALSILVTAAAAAILILFGSTFLGWVAAVLNGIVPIPQLIDVFKTRDIEGVSSASWTLAAINNVVWFSYGLTLSDRIIVSTNVWFGAMSTLIVVVTKLRRSRVQQTSNNIGA